MEPHAWLRSRLESTYLHAVDDGIVASVRRRNASVGADWDSHFAARLSATAAAAQRGRDGPVMETGGIGDGVLLRHAAGRVDNLVAREGFTDHIESSGTRFPSPADVLWRSTGTSELLLLAGGDSDDILVFVVRAPADRGGRGGGKKAAAAAADVFLARANRGRCMTRIRLAIELGPTFWVHELREWLRYRPRDAWSWAGVVGVPITQDDGE